ncbi:MAG: tetratricopeptide repeat protein [candidate division WOR-3 bacterium]
MRVKHRVSKDELKEDKFQKFVEKAAEFYYADPKRFWVGTAAVLVVIVGVILILQNRPRPVKNPEAELRLMDALSNFYQGNNEYAEGALKELAGKFPKDNAGIKAHFYLGSIYFRSDPPRLDEAKREFITFIKRAGNDPVLVPAANIGIAACEEQAGNYLKAATIYEGVYQKNKSSPLGYEALMAAGRCYRLAGALDRAERLFSDYLEKEKPSGPKAEDVKAQLAYVRALKSRF